MVNTLNFWDRLNSSITFAEKGEFETAKSFLKTVDKKVLLAYKQGSIEKKPLEYALNVCKRIGAQLEILYIEAANSGEGIYEPSITEYATEAQKQGIQNNIITKKGCIKEEVIKHTRANNNIVFVVTDSAYQIDMDCEGRVLPDLLKTLECPLVLVSDNA